MFAEKVNLLLMKLLNNTYKIVTGGRLHSWEESIFVELFNMVN
jgi:hypothetical protein